MPSETIGACREFGASERNTRVLQYIEEEALASCTDRIKSIKAYSIARSVFGRDATFDPEIDPIVRIAAKPVKFTARRLRHTGRRVFFLGGV